ncbi:hypothetical protein [Dulcicalothrix desertica]|uniref:hypothetical protein n=1 Tax=Dulcicalothrix desertica TaxID=32056 RepID=UPI003B51DDEE
MKTPEQARYKLKGVNKHLKLFEIKEVKLTESKSKDNKTIYKMEGVGHRKIKRDRNTKKRSREIYF